MLRRSFHNFWKSPFIALYGALVRLHLECGVPVCYLILVAEINHLERIQILVSVLVTGVRYLPYGEGLQRLTLHSLQRRRRLTHLISVFKISTGLLDIDPNLFFLPPTQCGLRGHPYKALQGETHRRWRRSAFSVRFVKYWNKLPASVVTVPSVNVLKKRLEEVWTKDFPHHPH